MRLNANMLENHAVRLESGRAPGPLKHTCKMLFWRPDKTRVELTETKGEQKGPVFGSKGDQGRSALRVELLRLP